MTTKSPTPHAVMQAAKVAYLIERGWSRAAIGKHLGVSAVRATQIANRIAELRPYFSSPDPFDRLRSRRAQLYKLRADALNLAVAIRRDLRDLDEELLSAEVDVYAGLR